VGAIYRWTSSARNDPKVTFEEVIDAFPPGVGGGWGLAVGACDLDGDQLPELYVAHDFGPDRLFWNRSTRGHIRFALLAGEAKFAAPKSYVLGRDSFKSMGVDFADLNDDGRPDIYVSNIMNLKDSRRVRWFHQYWRHQRNAKGIAPYVIAANNSAFP
jgi:hypothetical protein